MARNDAGVSVGRDHDTPAFAVASIRQWWTMMGRRAYPTATALFLTAEAGGSKGYRCRAWKRGLQPLADDLQLRIHVSQFPPGTSQWNQIEHRLFCHITKNWRGRPLRRFESVVALIGHTRTDTGLRVTATLDKRRDRTGVVVSRADMKQLALHPHPFPRRSSTRGRDPTVAAARPLHAVPRFRCASTTSRRSRRPAPRPRGVCRQSIRGAP